MRDFNERRLRMTKMKRLLKDIKKKHYVFYAIINDVKMLKKNNDLSFTFKTHAFESLKKRAEILQKQMEDNLNQQIAFWENTSTSTNMIVNNYSQKVSA